MDMPTIDNVIRHDDKRVSLTMRIDPGLDVFRGHFDDVPIVPGVVQIHWALQFAAQYLQPLSSDRIAGMEAIKFQHVMRPNIKTSLELEFSNGKISFVFSSDTVRFSSGRIVMAK